MAKYYRNGRPVAEDDLPPRTLKGEPKWTRVNKQRRADCRVCQKNLKEASFVRVYDAGVGYDVYIDTCRVCYNAPKFQDKPESGLWDNCYWTGAEDTTGYSISSSTPIEHIKHNPEFPCGTRRNMTPCKLEV